MSVLEFKFLPAAFRKIWLPWTFVGVLTLLCATLAFLQNRWINEISTADRNRLNTALQTGLSLLSAEFDRQVAASFAELKPTFADITEFGTQVACARQYVHWRNASEPVFSRMGLVNLEGTEPELAFLDMNTGTFGHADWPARWMGMRKRFEARMTNAVIPPIPSNESALLDFPLFGSMHRGLPERPRGESGGERDAAFEPRPPKEDWLLVEVSTDYVRSTLLPPLLEKYVTGAGMPAYDADVVAAGQPTLKLLRVDGGQEHQHKAPDASVDLLTLRKIDVVYRPVSGVPTPAREPEEANPGRWRLELYHRGYSLEDQVTSGRARNLALSGGILILILTTVVVLLRYARKSQQLASLQMNFVAGVSHELRTPLTVIRTAAYNLRGRVANRPEQVEKYGQVIQNESEKLSILVEQVLRYGAASAGRAIGDRRLVAASQVIWNSLESSLAKSVQGSVTVEQHIDPELPMILADELALKHALQNLLDNGVKHGSAGGGWISLTATEVSEGRRRSVEIRVSDRGPGIPPDEQVHLFDAFFRGKRALQEQVHGTGLGLNLVKSIVEAHGGTIRVESEPGSGAVFIVRIPVAEEEMEDVFSNSAG